jgi:DedD protein
MSSTQDEAFREIQLSGKQLVFVFMAGVVIAVVIFLIGVQVGRGVLAQRGLPDAVDASAENTAEPPPPPATSQPANAPVTAGEKLSYAERLAAPEPASETLKKSDAAPSPKPEPPAPKAEPPSPAARVAPVAPVAPASSEPAGDGFAIQVAALRERAEADAIVKRLAGKGYPAYLVAPTKDAPAMMYRVRVGKYKERREADTVAARLQKEEQFKPWVVR